MPTVLHIVDSRTPPEMLRQLELLARPGDLAVSAGPPPSGPVALPQQAVHCPMGSARLGGLRMRHAAAGAEVLHAWSERALPAARELALATGKPMVASLPCVPPTRAMDSLGQAVGAGLFAVTVPTEHGRSRLVAGGLPARSVHVLPPAAAEPADRPAARRGVREALGLAEADRLLVAPDGMVRGAGHDHASWAHAILRVAIDGVCLLFAVGGPAEAHVRSFAATTGYDEEVFFTHERFAVPEALAAADLAVFLHERDVGVAALAEAMAAGLPIVASRTGEAAECAPDGQAALLVPPRDPRAAAGGVLRLLEEPGLSQRLAAEAARRAAERFDPQAVRRRLEGIYAAAAAATVY